MFYVFMGLSLCLALIVVTAVAVSLTAVVRYCLPINRVPLTYNLRNLQVRWKTTLVTGLAFTLVVGILVVMLAFVRGMDRVTQVSAVPGNVIVLADGATDEVFSDVRDVGFPDGVMKKIPTVALKSGKTLPMISKEIYVLVSHVVQQNSDGGRQRRFIQFRGLANPEVSAAVHAVKLASGRWWVGGLHTLADPKGATGDGIGILDVVLGDGIAKTLGGDLGKGPLQPGDILQIGPEKCHVAGVLEPSGTFGSEVWASDIQVQNIFKRHGKYSSFVLRTDSEETAEEVAKSLKVVNDEKYNSYTEKAYYARLEENNAGFRFAVYFLGIVMSIGGILGVMNTMFAAINHRAKDIGILRLLGYTRFQVVCSFLVESLMIAFLGGVLGCLAGWFFDGLTATSIVSGGGGGGGKSVVLRLVVDPGILAIGMVFALVMGAVGGLVPSLSAMRLKPLESLR